MADGGEAVIISTAERRQLSAPNGNERFERQLLQHIRALKLPEPETQYRYATALVNHNGKPRQFRADFAWPAVEYRLLVEVQGGIFMRGGAHSLPTNIVRDIEKHQCAALLGWYALPVTTDQVKKGEAIGLIEQFFSSKGWSNGR
jgi:hypothetical protein